VRVGLNEVAEKAANERGAARSARINVELEKVLATLDVVSVKRYRDNRGVDSGEYVVRGTRRRRRDRNRVNDTVGEALKSVVDTTSEAGAGRKNGGGAIILRASQADRDSGEGLIRPRGEGESESLSGPSELSEKRYRLGLIKVVRRIIVLPEEHGVGAVRAALLVARDSGPLGVADARAGAFKVPGILGRGHPHGTNSSQLSLVGGVVGPVAVDSAERDLVHVRARAVAVASGLAYLAGASLALIAVEAVALAGGTVADSLGRALGVVVDATVSVGGIDPRKLEGAKAVRAVSSDGASHAPVVVALADILVLKVGKENR